MDMDFILFLIPVAFYIGWKANEAWMLLSFRTLLQELNISNDQLRKIARAKGITLPEVAEVTEEDDPNSQLPTLEVRVEKTDLGLFAYRKDNSLFLARGEDREELMKNLVDNLSNVRVIVAKEDGADLISS